jgi:hypothetical protein
MRAIADFISGENDRSLSHFAQASGISIPGVESHRGYDAEKKPVFADSQSMTPYTSSGCPELAW